MNLPLQLSEPQTCNEPAGWEALLQITFVQKKTHHSTQTVMGRSHHYGPLRVQRPFYPEGDLAHIYILHPPGGVVGGDRLTVEFKIDNNAQALATTPGSGKFYLSAGNWAILKQRLEIKSGASLEWFPQENILFSGARLRTRTRIDCQDNAIFIGWDISCLGRPSSNEKFSDGAFDSRFEFYHNDTLLFVENQRVFDKQTLHAIAGLRGNPIQATMLAFPCNHSHLETVHKQLEKYNSELIAATLIDDLLVLRVLGDSSENIKLQLIQIWQVLRPMMLKRFAVLPRIWAT